MARMAGLAFVEQSEITGPEAELIRATGREARSGLSRSRMAREKNGTWKAAYKGNIFLKVERRLEGEYSCSPPFRAVFFNRGIFRVEGRIFHE